jgi:methylenetetrahydrofolate dehydrogenase (NADP+)/methenyltetrahydrofolate cyclohydrolase
VGIESHTVRLPATASEEEVLKELEILNKDSSVDGILVQLPLPKHISERNIIDALDPEKDVDGITSLNISRLWTLKRGQADFCIPCTPAGCMRLLEEAGINPDGKNAVVLGRSNIVGLPVAKLLLNAGATVTICHSRTRNIGEITRQADILVAAIGQPKFVKGDMLKEGVAIIDVGINQDPVTKELCGDVDFESALPKASAITPVPGGVGPMTICLLLENTIECFLRKF